MPVSEAVPVGRPPAALDHLFATWVVQEYNAAPYDAIGMKPIAPGRSPPPGGGLNQEAEQFAAAAGPGKGTGLR